jgi:hypothetical protein
MAPIHALNGLNGGIFKWRMPETDWRVYIIFPLV